MKLFHNYYTYILQCNDLSYYVGVTNDLDRRLQEHNNDENKLSYTFDKRPVIMKYYEHFVDINQAIRREKQLKGWGRKKKEALFEQDFVKLVELSKSKNLGMKERDKE